MSNILRFFKRHIQNKISGLFMNGLKKIITSISFLDAHNGFFIFIATVALVLITALYLKETRLSRKLLEKDIYTRSLPVMICNSPVNEKVGDKIVTKIRITNNGASAFDENIIIFWVDHKQLIFENGSFVAIEGIRIPIYRYQSNHVTNSWRELTLDFSRIEGKIKNLDELYVLIILKYKVPLSREYSFEKFCYKCEFENDVSRWQIIPIPKVEELYKRAHNFTLNRKFPSEEKIGEIEEIKTFLEKFFLKSCEK